MVLVIDDDAEIRQALTDVLEDEQYSVVCASNGREALTKIEDGLCPDIILLDVMMPVMDGWHFLSARLAYPQLIEIPIIIISAGMEAMSEARKVGVFDVIRKPLHISSLVRQIEHCRRASPSAESGLQPNA
jgi:two-component system, chemotaxis family, chemotaxis protein CheY